jgi:hypothetical protein
VVAVLLVKTRLPTGPGNAAVVVEVLFAATDANTSVPVLDVTWKSRAWAQPAMPVPLSVATMPLPQITDAPAVDMTSQEKPLLITGLFGVNTTPGAVTVRIFPL